MVENVPQAGIRAACYVPDSVGPTTWRMEPSSPYDISRIGLGWTAAGGPATQQARASRTAAALAKDAWLRRDPSPPLGPASLAPCPDCAAPNRAVRREFRGLLDSAPRWPAGPGFAAADEFSHRGFGSISSVIAARLMLQHCNTPHRGVADAPETAMQQCCRRVACCSQ